MQFQGFWALICSTSPACHETGFIPLFAQILPNSFFTSRSNPAISTPGINRGVCLSLVVIEFVVISGLSSEDCFGAGLNLTPSKRSPISSSGLEVSIVSMLSTRPEIEMQFIHQSQSPILMHRSLA
jgi:hypothetical protein